MAGAAKGTQFKIGTVTVAELNSIGGVSVSADTVDTTALDNTSGYRTFIGGFKDGGEVSLSGFLNHTDAGQLAIYAAFESGAVTSCSIVFPTAISASWTFDGVVTAFDATVKVSGKPTLA
jgi:predicted secreted protein